MRVPRGFSGVALATLVTLIAVVPVGWTLPAAEARKAVPYRVIQKRLPRVDNLALAPDGTLYATLEGSFGEGYVVRIAEGRVIPLLRDLNRPDGLLLHGDRLYVTEEVENGRVLEYDLAGGTGRTWTVLRKPEGIDRLPDGSLVVSEDMPDGRVLVLDPVGAMRTLAEPLNRPEGLAVGRDGAVYVAETATGRVLRVAPDGGISVVVSGLVEPDQVEMGPDGALWISEDARPGRILRFVDGVLTVFASGLDAPQGMAFGPDGTVYVAEQERGRILAFPPPAATAPAAP